MAELGPQISSFIGQLTQPVIPLWDHVIVGQMLPAGTATPNSLYEITSITDYNTLFDAKSDLAFKIAQYKVLYPNGALFVIPLSENVSGVASTSTITVTGTPTENKSEVFFVNNYSTQYTIAILTTDTPTTIAGKIVTAVGSNAMFTASNAAGVVTFTHRTKGTLYNNAPVGLIGKATAGVSYAFTTFAGGSVDPVLTTSIFENVIGNQRCNLFVPHYAFKVANDYMTTKINVPGSMLSGFVFACIRDTKANILSYTTTNYPNSPHASLLVDYLETTSTTVKGAGRTFLDNINVLGTQLFAFLDKSIRNGESLVDSVIFTQNYLFDSSVNNLNRPTRDILFKTLTPNDRKYQLTTQEQNDLRNKGYSSVKFYTDGNSVATNDLITTDYAAQTLQGRYGVFSHLRSIRILQYVQGYLFKKYAFFLSDKNAGGTNSTNPKNVNEITMKAFTQETLLELMPGGVYELLSAFSDQRASDGASYESIFNGKVKSEQGFKWSGSNGIYSPYTPILLDNNLVGVTSTILPQNIN